MRISGINLGGCFKLQESSQWDLLGFSKGEK